MEMCLWKLLKSLSKITPRLRTLSDGAISLSSNLTGKWLESLCLCCFVPIIINSVLLEFSLKCYYQPSSSLRLYDIHNMQYMFTVLSFFF